ncbi:MAG: IS91 family transposase [Burkholderiales bacterium]
MQPTLQGIFESCFARFAQGRKLPLRAHRAARAIEHCRTAALGGHIQRCPEGHVARVHYNACRHRSCPRCSALPRARWAEAQAARLLGCEHYHVVFTLPHELIALWAYNRAVLNETLFQCARDTLIELSADARFLGATPGILMALHTWGRTLNHHPHVHCLISGGGLTPGGDWKAVQNGYLLPVRVVKALYRGKMLAAIGQALEDDRLRLPAQDTQAHWARCLRALHKKNWNVHLAQRYPHGRGVMRYLARYVKGGPIHDQRLQSANAHEVVFTYTDHHDARPKRMRLATDEFIARVLWHAPEPGQHSVRHYGLYANSANAKRARARQHLGQLPASALPGLNWQAELERLGAGEQSRCPRCKRTLIRGASLARGQAFKQISVSNAVPGGFAQLSVEASTPSAPSITSTGPPSARGLIFLRSGVPLN